MFDKFHVWCIILIISKYAFEWHYFECDDANCQLFGCDGSRLSASISSNDPSVTVLSFD